MSGRHVRDRDPDVALSFFGLVGVDVGALVYVRKARKPSDDGLMAALIAGHVSADRVDPCRNGGATLEALLPFQDADEDVLCRVSQVLTRDTEAPEPVRNELGSPRIEEFRLFGTLNPYGVKQ